MTAEVLYVMFLKVSLVVKEARIEERRAAFFHTTNNIFFMDVKAFK